MSIYGIDGTDMWQRGPKLARRKSGAYAEVEDTGLPLDVAELRPAQSYECAHGKLRGEERCLGCGLTKAEIRVEEGR
jgi:hypothetical protein